MSGGEYIPERITCIETAFQSSVQVLGIMDSFMLLIATGDSGPASPLKQSYQNEHLRSIKSSTTRITTP